MSRLPSGGACRCQPTAAQKARRFRRAGTFFFGSAVFTLVNWPQVTWIIS